MLASMLTNLKKVKAADVVYQLKKKARTDEILKKTSQEAEKALDWVVTKVVTGASEPVSEEVRNEIVTHLMAMSPRELPKALRDEAASLKDVRKLKNLRADIANKWVGSAKDRLAARGELNDKRE